MGKGLRAIDGGDPRAEVITAEHQAYAEVLCDAGVETTILPALEDYPDSIFVEDPALVFPEGAILLRPGAQSRFEETAELSSTLHGLFDTVLSLPAPGFVEGGDVLVTADKVMIGLSARTNQVGANALCNILSEFDRKSEIVHTPDDVLHFKSDCALLDEETILSTNRLACSGVFEGYRVIIVPEGEESAANALRINDIVMVGAHHHHTIELLDAHAYKVVPLETKEIAKIDAGLSCMSLRWRAAAN